MLLSGEHPVLALVELGGVLHFGGLAAGGVPGFRFSGGVLNFGLISVLVVARSPGG